MENRLHPSFYSIMVRKTRESLDTKIVFWWTSFVQKQSSAIASRSGTERAIRCGIRRLLVFDACFWCLFLMQRKLTVLIKAGNTELLRVLPRVFKIAINVCWKSWQEEISFCMVLVSARFQLERESAVQFVEISFFLPCLCSCSHVDDAINFLWRRICINYNVQLVLTQVVLGWLGNSICHLHTSHNALHLPPKILYKRCLQFLLEQLYYPGEMKNKGDAKFGGGK